MKNEITDKFFRKSDLLAHGGNTHALSQVDPSLNGQDDIIHIKELCRDGICVHIAFCGNSESDISYILEDMWAINSGKKESENIQLIEDAKKALSEMTPEQQKKAGAMLLQGLKDLAPKVEDLLKMTGEA